ncbi:MAG: Fe-S oxidoreductase [Clostridiales bacterium]|nr:MAG: Fe-S oxidoreductase [Clostridiales bacterium]HJA31525.1 TIGR03936 family radical SAM-associated protein [Candidatus Eisenbergiella pullicola]
MRVRVKFAKYGALRFIGHLDVMRFFQKAIRRAQIDVAYTGGYSPHQIMTFAAPLGLGMSSFGEYMDIEIHSHQGKEDFLSRLRSVCPEGIEILDAKALPQNAENAMASVAAASWEIGFADPQKNFEAMRERLQEFLAQEEIIVAKEGKKGPRQVNIRPGIRECGIRDGKLCVLADAGSSGNIRPDEVAEQLLRFCGEDVPGHPGAFSVVRKETWMNAGTQESPEFQSLDAMGEDF